MLNGCTVHLAEKHLDRIDQPGLHREEHTDRVDRHRPERNHSTVCSRGRCYIRLVAAQQLICTFVLHFQ